MRPANVKAFLGFPAEIFRTPAPWDATVAAHACRRPQPSEAEDV